MAELILNVFVDGLMALLLLITIFYCWKLNNRIKVLQDSKSELANIIMQFDESTKMATRSIGDIHTATSRISENMQHKIDKANYLADDLQFMIEKGNKIADRMEGDISASRKSTPSPSRKSNARAGRPERVTPDLDDEKSAPRKSARAEARKAARKEPSGGGDAAKASLESVLQRVSKKKGGVKDAGAETEARSKRPTARLRSKSEQELFDALKDVGEV